MTPVYTAPMANDDLAARIKKLERERHELDTQRETRETRFDEPLKTERSRLDEALREPMETLGKIARRKT